MAINDTDLLLNLPFDEAGASPIAYDYATGRHDATVDAATFIPGRQGNCIHFDGAGTATIDADVVNLAGDFTLLAWIKPTAQQEGETRARLGFLFNTPGLDGALTSWLEFAASTWYYIAISKEGNTVTLYVDTQRAAVITLRGELTGFGLIQDYYSTENALADIDEVKLYGVPLSAEDITESLNSVKMLEYYINGVNFKDLDIRVSSSNGVLDLPKLKTPHSIDWPDYHGEIIDLDDKRVEARTITLNCWMRATGKIDFVQKVNQLYRHFMTDGTARLMIAIHPTKPLVYEVYAPDGISHDKRWHDDKMIGTFTLKLKEPDPVKRVLRHMRNAPATAKVTVAFKSDKIVTIHWGDGTTNTDLWGDYTGEKAITHTYTADGTYYPIIAGVVEQITDFSTNAIIVWDMI